MTGGFSFFPFFSTILVCCFCIEKQNYTRNIKLDNTRGNKCSCLGSNFVYKIEVLVKRSKQYSTSQKVGAAMSLIVNCFFAKKYKNVSLPRRQQFILFPYLFKCCHPNGMVLKYIVFQVKHFQTN